MQFVIGIVDKKSGKVIIEGAHSNHIGVSVLLERLTEMSVDSRNQFMRKLIGTDVAVHQAERTDELQYDITAMKL